MHMWYFRFGEAQVEVWRFGQANMTKAMEMGRPRTETADKVSPQLWKVKPRMIAVRGFEAVRSRLVQTDCGHKLRTGAVRGFQPERSLLEWIGRGPRPRTEPVRGRYQNQVTHLFLGQTRVCRVDPIQVLSYYK